MSACPGATEDTAPAHQVNPVWRNFGGWKAFEGTAKYYNHVHFVVIRLGVYPGQSVMAGTTNDLDGVLDDYRKFVREKDLAPAGDN